MNRLIVKKAREMLISRDAEMRTLGLTLLISHAEGDHTECRNILNECIEVFYSNRRYISLISWTSFWSSEMNTIWAEEILRQNIMKNDK